MAFSVGRETIFLYGFAKSERDNIGPDELDFWRRVARGIFRMDDAQRQAMLAARDIMVMDND